MSRDRGFTLLELVITLIILGIVILMAHASYENIMSSQSLSQRADKIYYTLRLAKTEAIKRNKRVYVHFCQKNNLWKMGMTDLPACDCFTLNACQLDGIEYVDEMVDGKKLFIKKGDISFVGKQASYHALRFTTATGTVTISNKNNQSLSIIQSAMRLRICSPDRAELGYSKC